LVIHSATKFLGGHADALGGVVCGPEHLVKQIYHYREITGASRHVECLKLPLSDPPKHARDSSSGASIPFAKEIDGRLVAERLNHTNYMLHEYHVGSQHCRGVWQPGGTPAVQHAHRFPRSTSG
jgi:cystathionine gamma-synthase